MPTSGMGRSINGRYQLEMRRPLFPRKQTWIGPARAGKLGEFQRFSPGGLFGLNSDFLRMNQDHRSGADNRQRFDHPPPMVTARLAFATNSAPDEFFQNA